MAPSRAVGRAAGKHELGVMKTYHCFLDRCASRQLWDSFIPRKPLLPRCSKITGVQCPVWYPFESLQSGPTAVPVPSYTDHRYLWFTQLHTRLCPANNFLRMDPRLPFGEYETIPCPDCTLRLKALSPPTWCHKNAGGTSRRMNHGLNTFIVF